jgi:phospholipase C
MLQFLEQFTGVREPNISAWRRSTFGDLTTVFRFRHSSKKPPKLPDTTGPLVLARYSSTSLPSPVLPGVGQQLPQQEKGHRKRISTKRS